MLAAALLLALAGGSGPVSPILPAADLAGGAGLPVASPASVGMSAERLEAIDRVVERGIEAGGYPGAAVIVGRKGKAVL